MKKPKKLFNISILVILVLILVIGVVIMINLGNNSSLEGNDLGKKNSDSAEENIVTCVPETCISAGAECSYIDDGCGNSISCGFCSEGYDCMNYKCIKIVEEIKEGCVIDGEETGERCDYPSDCYQLAFSMGEEDMRSVSCLGGKNEITYGFDLDRELPNEIVGIGETFTIIYSSDREGKWGASMIDSISGGCKFSNGKNIIKTVFLSEGGHMTQSYEITAPDYPTTCVFVGDYMIGTEGLKNFVDVVIDIA